MHLRRLPVRVELLLDEPDRLAADTPAAEGKVEVAEPVPEAALVPEPEADAPVDGPSVAEGLLSMKPSDGSESVLLGVPPDDSVDAASALEEVVVAEGSGLDANVNVCVVAYVPPRSSLMVLSATPPSMSAHCSTVTVNVESSADDTAVPCCRLCNS